MAFGAAELEVLRRLNVALAGELNGAQHRFVVHDGVRRRLAVSASRPLRLPIEHQEWAHDYGVELTQQLEQRGVAVVGDLADLVPALEPAEGPQLDEVTEQELLEATQAALVSLALAHGALYRRYRRAFLEREGRLPDAHEVASSRARAAGFAFRKAVLRRADESRLLSRVVRTYLDRVTRTKG